MPTMFSCASGADASVVMRWRFAATILLLCAAQPCRGNGLVGPGAVAPYSGGGQRARGYGYVRDPAAGFFVTGSSLSDMNGVYARVEQVPGLQDGQLGMQKTTRSRRLIQSTMRHT